MLKIDLTILLASLMFLAGCTVGPDFVKPNASVEKSFPELTSQTTTNPPPANWWKTFDDPELTKLMEEALRQNYDLEAAVVRIRESRFQRSIAAADMFPTVDADAGFAHSYGSKNVVLALHGSSGGSGSSSSSSSSASTSGKARSQSAASGSAGGSASANDSSFDDQLNPLGAGGLPGATTDLYQVGFDASWEIDVFGGKRRATEAANDELQAAIERQHDLTITLLAEVARDYFELRGFQQRLEIARKNLKDQNDIVELTRSRAHSGLATDADVARATAEAATTASTIPPLRAQVEMSIHALSVLIAREPEALKKELTAVQALPLLPPEVPVGLPSELVERRPDIRESEREVAAANARIGQSESDLFPKFALVGTTGLDSSSIQNVFDWDSRYFLISPTVTWRIFDAGRILSNMRLQKALTEEAELQFRSNVLKALQEVEDNLVAYATEQERYNRLRVAYDQNTLALELSRKQYQQGLVSFVEVLDAERNALSSQDDLTQSNLTKITDLVALYKALGGGWH
jgi:multidrug efflux system outer membrane protein